MERDVTGTVMIMPKLSTVITPYNVIFRLLPLNTAASWSSPLNPIVFYLESLILFLFETYSFFKLI
jgi:hypothetical protein